MKIQALIEKLQELKAIHGDINVKIWPYDGQMNCSDLKCVEVFDTECLNWDAKRNDWERRKVEPYVLLDENGA